ncbi:hypothetical protein BGZ47_004165, partial [Haplosporangium gracile]
DQTVRSLAKPYRVDAPLQPLTQDEGHPIGSNNIMQTLPIDSFAVQGDGLGDTQEIASNAFEDLVE